ncbi:hypothetical protein NMY22_g4177 [Coprinellus aureogranulatus]|nr:hypothetical protein NMY22_g4177 [Coprinellus aureogranulatus]
MAANLVPPEIWEQIVAHSVDRSVVTNASFHTTITTPHRSRYPSDRRVIATSYALVNHSMSEGSVRTLWQYIQVHTPQQLTDLCDYLEHGLPSSPRRSIRNFVRRLELRLQAPYPPSTLQSLLSSTTSLSIIVFANRAHHDSPERGSLIPHLLAGRCGKLKQLHITSCIDSITFSGLCELTHSHPSIEYLQLLRLVPEHNPPTHVAHSPPQLLRLKILWIGGNRRTAWAHPPTGENPLLRLRDTNCLTPALQHLDIRDTAVSDTTFFLHHGANIQVLALGTMNPLYYGSNLQTLCPNLRTLHIIVNTSRFPTLRPSSHSELRFLAISFDHTNVGPDCELPSKLRDLDGTKFPSFHALLLIGDESNATFSRCANALQSASFDVRRAANYYAIQTT